jgi:hypothetical protein
MCGFLASLVALRRTRGLLTRFTAPRRTLGLESSFTALRRASELDIIFPTRVIFLLTLLGRLVKHLPKQRVPFSQHRLTLHKQLPRTRFRYNIAA